MKLDWSEQSSHIRTLYRPWQPGDGYEEDIITAAESQLRVHLPTLLRAFYRAWGRRQDLTQIRDCLLAPDELVIQTDALIFGVENQATYYWAVRREFLEQFNPPVVFAAAKAGRSVWEMQPRLTWRSSHAHLSDFLDDLTYENALSGGAIHGGSSDLFRPNGNQQVWLEQHWRHAVVTPMCFGMEPDVEHTPLRLFVRDGQALMWGYGCTAAVREAQALDEISQALQITWVRRW
jgi:hypothetical protein